MCSTFRNDQTYIIVYEPLEVGLTYEEQPIKIVGPRVKQVHHKAIPLVKVIRTHHGASEVTWDTKDEMKNRYPYLFERHVLHKFLGCNFL